MDTNEEVEWLAPEYEYLKKDADWYWALGIIAVSLIAAAIVFGNYLLVLLIVLGMVTLVLYGSKKPELIKFKIDKRGVQIKDRLHQYEQLKSFYLKYNQDGRNQLLLESERIIMPIISISLENISEDKVREILLKRLPEKELREPAIQKIMDWLGF